MNLRHLTDGQLHISSVQPNVLLFVSRTASRSLINELLSLLRDLEGQTGRTLDRGLGRGGSNQLQLRS